MSLCFLNLGLCVSQDFGTTRRLCVFEEFSLREIGVFSSLCPRLGGGGGGASIGGLRSSVKGRARVVVGTRSLEEKPRSPEGQGKRNLKKESWGRARAGRCVSAVRSSVQSRHRSAEETRWGPSLAFDRHGCF
jgi:hypothetical protein